VERQLNLGTIGHPAPSVALEPGVEVESVERARLVNGQQSVPIKNKFLIKIISKI